MVWRLCLLAGTLGLVSAQDPATLAKLRSAYRTKCEEARNDYLAALRLLHASMKAAGKTDEAAAVAEELAAEEAAQPGAIRYISKDPPKDLGLMAEVSVHSLGGRMFGRPQPAAGGPIMASVKLPMGKISIAADFSDPMEETPDLVRFDFSGGNKFTEKNTITIAREEDADYARFGPKILEVVRGDRTIPVNVFGTLRATLGGDYMLDLGIGPVVEATCLFGDEPHKVLLADASGRLDFVRRTATRRTRFQTDGSRMCIDVENDGTYALKGVYGQPVRVAGNWYDIVLENQTLSAWPLDLQTAEITFPKEILACDLTSRNHAFGYSHMLPINAIPAGDYAIGAYCLNSAARTDYQAGWLFASGPTDEQGKPKPVNFPAGKTSAVPIGEPLAARVVAKRKNGAILLSLQVTDRGGGQVMQLRLPHDIRNERRSIGDSRPSPAKVTVEDANGKAVYQALLRYESGRFGAGHPEAIAASKSWEPPADLKGRVIIKVEFDARPFRLETKDTEFVIE